MVKEYHMATKGSPSKSKCNVVKGRVVGGYVW